MFRIIWLVIMTTLMTIIICLGLMGYYIWVKNPLNVRTCLVTNFMNATSTVAVKDVIEKNSADIAEKSENPLISNEQAGLLEKAGISVDSLPSTITPTMQACFEEKLGKDRVAEIKGGSIPNPLELYKAKSCF